jgi:hypothetical protein
VNIPYLSKADSQNIWTSYANEFIELTNQLISHISLKAQKIINYGQLETAQYYLQLQASFEEIEISPLTKSFNHSCTTIEKVFNIASCMLWLSSYTSPLRILFGEAQAIAGIALTVFSEILLLISNANEDLDDSPKTREKWQQLSKYGSSLIIHGCLNSTRGTIELFINTITFSIGNLALILPNIMYGRSFVPLYIYKDEPENNVTPSVKTSEKDIAIFSELDNALLIPMLTPDPL